MKHFIRRMAAAALSLSMALGMSAVASAATSSNVYDLKVQDKQVQFLLDNKVAATYDINNDNIQLITDREGDFLVCFFDDRGNYRGVSLGRQRSLKVSGVISQLRLDESLNSSIRLTVASDALVKDLNVRSDTSIYIDGRVSDLATDADVDVEVSSTGVVSRAELDSRRAKLHAEKGATVKNVQAFYRTNVTGDVDKVSKIEEYSYYDDDEYGYSDNEDRLHIRLEAEDIYAREGDTLRDLLGDLEDAVYAYVDDSESDRDGESISGRVQWRGENVREELESSGRYSFTFTPSSSKYRTTRGTVYIVVD
ncbi:MAG: hypothetical protein HFG26_10715 [Provencibacterium sp.]|nr:hypothetical protein [Provencibacterium sp.]